MNLEEQEVSQALESRGWRWASVFGESNMREKIIKFWHDVNGFQFVEVEEEEEEEPAAFCFNFLFSSLDSQ